MRRFPALLVAAGLAAAPASAVAGPSDQKTPKVERFDWSIQKPRLGVMVTALTPELRTHFGAAADRGLLVARVELDSPAARAGIKVGDVLVEVGGTSVDEAGDVLGVLANSDGKVAVTVLRDKKRMTIDVDPKATPATSWLFEMMRKLAPVSLPPTTTT
jgi:S1-C subfamily serine protease